MEIITYVRKGAITHKDNQGNKGRTEAGNVQVMSAGTGIFHSEYNLEDEETSIYQIWIKPNKKGVTPAWDAAEFPKSYISSRLNLLVSGDGKAPLNIQQDARIFAGRLAQDTHITHRIRGKAYLLVSEGEIELQGKTGRKGDGFAISAEKEITLHASTSAEVLIIEVPGLEKAR